MGLFDRKCEMTVKIVKEPKPDPVTGGLRERTVREAFPQPQESPEPEVVENPRYEVQVRSRNGKDKKRKVDTFEASAVRVGAAGELILEQTSTVTPMKWSDLNGSSRRVAAQKRSEDYLFSFKELSFTDAEFEAFPVEWDPVPLLDDNWQIITRQEITHEEVIAPGKWESYGVFYKAVDNERTD